MKDINPLFATALFSEEREVTEVAIWTLVYGDGTFRFVNRDHPLEINLGDGMFRYEPLPFRRSTLEAQSDLQVDKLTLEMPNAELLVQYAASSERAFLGDLVLNGVLDYAQIDIWLVNVRNLGSMRHSSWEVVGSPQIDRSVVSVDLQSRMGMAIRKAPRLIVQESCGNALFDDICALVRALWTVGGVATGGNRLSMTSALVNPVAWFDLGEITFTSGANIGATRMVSEYLGAGVFTWSVPLRFAVIAGDQFEVVSGCNKTTDICENKFNNLARFRGFPNIPRAETVAN